LLGEDDEESRVLRPYNSLCGEWLCSEECWRAAVAEFALQ
jgi:hypothetical protein